MSFVFFRFKIRICERLGLKPRGAKNILEISIRSGEVLMAKEIFPKQEVKICLQKVSADFYVIGIEDFDVILGMNWLKKNKATIHCLRNCFPDDRRSVCIFS